MLASYGAKERVKRFKGIPEHTHCPMAFLTAYLGHFSMQVEVAGSKNEFSELQMQTLRLGSFTSH